MVNKDAVAVDAKRAHAMVLVYDVAHSNPNGDPDTNEPRQDALGFGYITGVAIKRHVRDFILATGRGESIAVREGVARDTMNAEYNELGHEKYIAKYWDIRAFGGLLIKPKNGGRKGKKAEQTDGEEIDTGDNKVALKGAIAVGDAVSTEQVEILNTTITFVGQQSEGEKRANMGQRPVVNKGTYVAPIFYSPFESRLSNEDLALFVEALLHHTDTSRSSNRTGVEVKALYIFTFDQFTEGRPHLLIKTGEETLADLQPQVSRANITVIRNVPAGFVVESASPNTGLAAGA